MIENIQTMNNIFEIKKILKILKKKKKIIGLCHGVFDLLHFGHLLHFQAAKKKCDYLFVSITSDNFVNKGPNRPLHNNRERIEFLQSLNQVDYVIISNEESAVDSINLIKPNFYFKGNDYKNNFLDKTKKIFKEIAAVKYNGGKIIYTNEKQMSSTKIINQIGITLNDQQKKFLSKLKKKTNYNSVIKEIEKIKNNKVLVVGDLIIDRYIFGNVLGKSGKEPHMVFGETYKDQYLGGSAKIGNHLSDFVDKISLISDLGPENLIKKFITKKLRKNVLHIPLLLSKNTQTCIKSRYIDTVTNYKLFGSYNIPNFDTQNFYDNLIKKLRNSLKKHDIVIIADYSNNFFNKNSLKLIKNSKKFISAMSQKNSNNSSFHSLSHLQNIDLLCINEGELRSEVRDKKTNIDLIAKNFLRKNNLRTIVVTRGAEGSLLIDKKLNKYYCPAFNSKPLDKIGAGDCMLSILSLLLKNKIHPEVSLLFASLAASKVINNLGNSYTLDKIELERDLEFLLK